MSDESSKAAQGAGAAATAAGATFEIGHQYIKDLSFEVPGAPGVFRTHATPEVSVNVDVTVERLDDRNYEVALKLDARGAAEGTPLFIVELVYAGLFRLGEVPQEQIQPLLLIEAPRLLFPFARSVVASVTRDGGLPPLMVAPIDFVGLYRRRMAQQQEQEKAQPQAGRQPEQQETAGSGEQAKASKAGPGNGADDEG